MSLSPAVRDAALRWIADDPDPATRDELQRLLAAALAGGPFALRRHTQQPGSHQGGDPALLRIPTQSKATARADRNGSAC